MTHNLNCDIKVVNSYLQCSTVDVGKDETFVNLMLMLSFLGTLFSVGVFSHLLKFDDAIIGVISCTSKILSGFMYAFATKTWHIYIGINVSKHPI